MQESQGGEALQGLEAYERLIDAFAEPAKAYWRSWGMPGEHMVRNVDSWTNHQRSYLQWLRQNHTAGNHQPRTTDQIV